MVKDRVSLTDSLSLIGGNAQRSFYRPELDVLRFFAFLMVLGSHSLPGPVGPGTKAHILRALQHGSALGVPVFFLLSAYLITDLLIREKRSTGTINIRNFYIRRILRIWPLYFLALAMAYAVGIFLPAQRLTAGGLASLLLLTGNWYSAYHDLPILALALWSLSIEEQFYLIWPSLVRRASERLVIVAAAVLWVGAQLYTWFLAGPLGMSSGRLRADSLIEFQYFALGTLLAFYLSGSLPQLSKPIRVVLIVLGLLALYGGEYLFGVLASKGPIVPQQAVLVFAVAGLGGSSLLYGFLGATLPRWVSPIVNLGKISYGLYVFHLGFISLTLLAAAHLHFTHRLFLLVVFVSLPITITTAQLSYKYLERPFLLLKKRFTLVESREI